MAYGDGLELESPLIYVGSGNLKQRWMSHTKWLIEFGLTLPNGRYEVWFCQPKRKGPNAGLFYKDVEADVLQWFRNKTGYLPFSNKKLQVPKYDNEYDKDFFKSLTATDSRYHWVLYPRTAPLSTIYYKGCS